MKKNLLIGSITNYAWEDVAPFFTSYARAGFENCDCVMFVANMREDTIEKIKSCGVNVLPIPEKFLNGRIVLYRFKLYEEFLQQHLEEYNMVFTADVRDVIFQRNIFKLYDGSRPFLLACLEDDILTQECNKECIVKMYGDDLHDKIKDNRIICMGTLLATSNEFLTFLRKMNERLEHSPVSPEDTNDQGVMNVIIYYDKLLSNVAAFNNNQDGSIMTIAISERENIKLDSNDNVLNGKGEIAAVVHQYDRHPDIVRKVINKFCPEYKFYYEVVIFKRPGLIWRIVRYYYRVRKIGLLKALYITIRKRLPGGEKFV